LLLPVSTAAQLLYPLTFCYWVSRVKHVIIARHQFGYTAAGFNTQRVAPLDTFDRPETQPSGWFFYLYASDD
jgi:hypothetical protein